MVLNFVEWLLFEVTGIEEVLVKRYSGNIYVKVFVNPNFEQTNKLNNGDFARAFIDGPRLYVWTSFESTHMDIYKALNLTNIHPIPLYIYGQENGIGHVGVTDYSTYTGWNHNPKVYEAIVNHKNLNAALGNPKRIEVSYYDEDIVGDWRNLNKKRINR